MRSRQILYMELGLLFSVAILYTLYHWVINTTQPLDYRTLPWALAIVLSGYCVQRYVRHNDSFNTIEKMIILALSFSLAFFFLITIAIYVGTSNM